MSSTCEVLIGPVRHTIGYKPLDERSRRKTTPCCAPRVVQRHGPDDRADWNTLHVNSETLRGSCDVRSGTRGSTSHAHIPAYRPTSNGFTR